MVKRLIAANQIHRFITSVRGGAGDNLFPHDTTPRGLSASNVITAGSSSPQTSSYFTRIA